MYFALYSSMCLWMIWHSQTNAAADPMWKVNDLVNDVKNNHIGALVTQLTEKATGEFDNLYHKLEGVLGQLAGGSWAQEAEAELDPKMLSECNCYCRCPHKTANTNYKVMTEVKDSVLELKTKVESAAKSLKDKIHEITSQYCASQNTQV